MYAIKELFFARVEQRKESSSFFVETVVNGHYCKWSESLFKQSSKKCMLPLWMTQHFIEFGASRGSEKGEKTFVHVFQIILFCKVYSITSLSK